MTDVDDEKLMHFARAAREEAYAPYSEYKVGAALLCNNGGIVKGYNVEVSGRNTSIHAEMMAMFKAVSARGNTKPYQKMAVAHDSNRGPCGLCLHTMSEFADDLEIIIEDEDGLRSFSLKEEFNNAYRPKNSHERRGLEE